MRAKTAAAASLRRRRCRSWRTSSGGAWRPRGIVLRSVIHTHRRAASLAFPMRLAALVAASSVIFLVGCAPRTTSSTGDFQGAEKAVAQKVADLGDAGSKRKPADICGGIVSEALRAKVAQGGASCNDEMKKAIEDVDQFDLTVSDVTVTGDRASARVQSKDRDAKVVRTFRFVRENGDWRISSFG